MGVGIKVETNGASGVGNQLTAEDIRKAKLLSSLLTRLLRWIVSMENLWLTVQLQTVSVRRKN